MTTRSMALGLLALIVTLPAQAAGTFSTNPADFSDLATQDFENTGFAVGSIFGACGSCPLTSLDLPGLSLYPETTFPDNVVLGEDCDIALPLETKWVGTISSPIAIELTGSETRVGFDYACQFQSKVNITVETSDGMVQSFMPPDQPATASCYPFGVEGFVGFDTGDPAVTISRVLADVSDGGVDNIRCTDCTSGPVPVKPSAWGSVKARYR